MPNNVDPEALILRRCYPVPVTFADLRAARCDSDFVEPWKLNDPNGERRHPKFRSHPPSKTVQRWWAASLKAQTGAIDEVYAVVDGRDVRVATTDGETIQWTGGMDPEHEYATGVYRNLLDKADRAGYWERPHEVRLDLSTRPVSHGEVTRAVLVGQEALERGGVVRS